MTDQFHRTKHYHSTVQAEPVCCSDVLMTLQVKPWLRNGGYPGNAERRLDCLMGEGWKIRELGNTVNGFTVTLTKPWPNSYSVGGEVHANADL